jgi:hypothetical protein
MVMCMVLYVFLKSSSAALIRWSTVTCNTQLDSEVCGAGHNRELAGKSASRYPHWNSVAVYVLVQ